MERRQLQNLIKQLEEAQAQIEKRQFTDQLLFTHRGFSGPLALNLSLFVNGKTQIIFNFLPEVDVENLIQKEKTSKKW